MHKSPVELWADWGWVPAGGSGVAVLSGRRVGAVVFPLGRGVAGRTATMGLEVALTGRLVDLLPVPPTAVVVVPATAELAAIVDDVRQVACGLLEVGGQVLTVGVANPGPVTPGPSGDLSLYNVPVDALPEALVELAAVARRSGLATRHGNHVLLLQRFAAPKATAVVQASPRGRVPVRINGRWGLTEGAMPADVFEVAADGQGVREKLAMKPTANVTAPGGTRTVDLSVRCRYQSSLSRAMVTRLAALARTAAVAVGHPLCLDVAVYGDTQVVLRCRPGESL